MKIGSSEWEVRVTEAKITVNVQTKSTGKLMLVRVSTRFKFARVRVIVSQLYIIFP